jgi:hypothetical protein
MSREHWAGRGLDVAASRQEARIDTVRRARKAKREGKAPTTQAGEFVREEMEHVRKGKHGACPTKQATR